MKPTPHPSADRLEHTKLPWKIGEFGRIIANRETLLLCGVAQPSGNHPQAREAEANAQFIVTACNSHSALVAALEGALHDLQEISIGINGLEGDALELKRLVDLVEGRRHSLRSALALASSTIKEGE